MKGRDPFEPEGWPILDESFVALLVPLNGCWPWVGVHPAINLYIGIFIDLTTIGERHYRCIEDIQLNNLLTGVTGLSEAVIRRASVFASVLQADSWYGVNKMCVNESSIPHPFDRGNSWFGINNAIQLGGFVFFHAQWVLRAQSDAREICNKVQHKC